MSSAAPNEPRGTGEEKKGLGKLVRRASKFFRKRGSARRSVSGISGGASKSTTAGAPTTSGDVPVSSAPAVAESTPEEQPAPAPVPTPAPVIAVATIQHSNTKPANARLAMSADISCAIQEERARALFAKYGLTLEPGEWTLPVKGDAARVEKRIRMRVHRTCHRCQLTFGQDRICGNCKHTCCKNCPRFPTKRVKESKDKAATASGDISQKPATMKVRRYCHMCNSQVKGRAGQCSNCSHMLCPQCIRDPVQSSKRGTAETPPLGQRQMKPIRVHVRWTCHQCSRKFKDLSTTCERCGHERCNECPREPPPQEKADLDPNAVRSVEERMKSINIASPAPAI
ncbi:MAG: hypothetical protein LQ351_007228 [Letrouitia transgressa]|nr:MAG: hypothetical protein LQ351_007228 [Letrouitia transgressa]